MVDQGESFLTNLTGAQGTWVFGDDAPEVFMQRSKCPAEKWGDSVLIQSVDGVEQALKHPDIFSSGKDAGFLGSETGLIPLQVDPPEHVRYRRILDRLFTPRRMAELEPGLVTFAHEVIDTFASNGECDFSTEFAAPFPGGTFLKLLGLPISGLAGFLDLKDRIIRPVAATPEGRDQLLAQAGREIDDLFQDALNARKAAKTDDLLGYLAGLEEEGQLTRAESVNICHQLLLGGLDTVTDTLETTFALLARRPDLQAELREMTDISGAVEELLRWSVVSPLQGRIAIQDTVIDGYEVKRGDLVKVMNGARNFSPTQYPDPLVVDLHRTINPHATFGMGVHRCLGSHLARVELRVGLRVWHDRIPEYRLRDGTEIRYSRALREIAHLPLVWSVANG